MGIIAGIKVAFRTTRRYRLRAFLMMLGVAIGISSLTALYSVGENAKQETTKRFKNMLGTFDTIMVRPGSGRTRGMPSLTNVDPTLKFEDARALETEIPEIDQLARLQSAFDIDVKYRDHSTATAVFGSSANWLMLRGDELAEGTFITEDDDRTLGRIAVIGTDVQTALFPDEDPVGKTIRIGEVPFQVKGVLKSRGAGPGGASLDNIVMIPVATASKRLFNRDFLTMLIARLKDPAEADTAINKITTLLRDRHHLAPTAESDFTLTSPKAVMAQVTQVGTTLSKTLTGVAAIATLIGGVVIMSLMLIAVNERRKEIGVRRSFGASRKDIMLQFMLEAVVVSCLGGLMGMAIGLSGTNAVALLQRMPPILTWNAIWLAVAISTIIGFLFGIYPAWKAARVEPVVALRS
ncbi:MAG TPA: ABC transporter permease [Blastocatellia bacterium]|nr:ABC transporter permease [Blastocatellia bacterium]